MGFAILFFICWVSGRVQGARDGHLFLIGWEKLKTGKATGMSKARMG